MRSSSSSCGFCEGLAEWQLSEGHSVLVLQMLLDSCQDTINPELTRPSEECFFLSLLNTFVVFQSDLTGLFGCVCWGSSKTVWTCNYVASSASMFLLNSEISDYVWEGPEQWDHWAVCMAWFALSALGFCYVSHIKAEEMWWKCVLVRCIGRKWNAM